MARGIIKFFIGLAVVIIAIYWIFTYTIPSYNAMKAAEQELKDAKADLAQKQENLKQAQKAADAELRSLIARGCVPTNQKYVWECP